MISAGEISIKIQPAGIRCKTVLSSTRPADIHELFTGKTVEQMLEAVPLLFSICRGAQSVAAVRAAEQAMGLEVSLQTEQQRDRLVSLEMLQEHLWTLLVGLPPLLALPVRHREMAQISQCLQKPMQQLRAHTCQLAAEPGSSPHPPSPGAEVFYDMQAMIFGNQSAGSDPPEHLLFTDAVAGDLLRSLKVVDFASANNTGANNTGANNTGDNSSGRSNPRLVMEQREPDQRNKAILEMDTLSNGGPDTRDDEDLGTGHSTTQWPSESGSLARMAGHPWALAYRDYALSSRLAAVLAETSRLLDGAVVTSPPKRRLGAQLGCADVETARGRLTCTLAVAGNKMQFISGNKKEALTVSRMQVLAPTDTHFHPKGIAAFELSQLPAENDRLLPQRAELLTRLINPCVGYRIDILPGTHAERDAQPRRANTGGVIQADTTDFAGTKENA